MKRVYHKKRSKGESRHLSRLIASNQQLFLPFLELVEQSSSMIGDVLDEVNAGLLELDHCLGQLVVAKGIAAAGPDCF